MNFRFKAKVTSGLWLHYDVKTMVRGSEVMEVALCCLNNETEEWGG
ncbi:hypothetical protein [Teredinibacter purpureus]|jgi:hypothetical protein|nr:hypothetical protein [Teredinibacter purpureus]